MQNNYPLMRQVGALWLCVLGQLASTPLEAQEPLAPEQLLDRYEFAEVQWSPDGRKLAVVVEEPASPEGKVSHIWMYDDDVGRLRQLTYTSKENSQPRWSPDGKSLAFLSSREESEPQIFVLPMEGGEASAVTTESSGVNGFEWSPDGEWIAYLSSESAPEASTDSAQEKDDEVVASESVKPTHLRIVSTVSADVSTVTEGRVRVSALTWQPNGRSLVISATDDFQVELLTDRIYSVSAGGGMTEIAKPDGPVSKLSVSPDGRFLAYIGSNDGGPIPHALFIQTLDGEEVVDLSGTSVDRMVLDLEWQNSDSIVALVTDGFGDRLLRIGLNGTIDEIKRFSDSSASEMAAAEGRIAYVEERSNAPQELHILDAGASKKISHLNSEFAPLATPSIIRYVAEDGTEIEAALYEPTHAKRPNQGWPTVLLIHGGPSGRWSHRINDWAQLLVARGFAVVAPNIRGSIGYGLGFIRANRHDWGGADYRDAIAAVDHLIDQGIADAERLAIAGWSYGGYMAAWAITQTDRFKAAIVGAAMTDLAVEYGTETAEINAYDTWYLGTPYENLEDFQRMSPMTYVRNVSTPALILIGENDEIDPPGQSWQFYRALRRYGVETELVVYPREPHTFTERAHIVDLMERMMAWIEVHAQ